MDFKFLESEVWASIASWMNLDWYTEILKKYMSNFYDPPPFPNYITKFLACQICAKTSFHRLYLYATGSIRITNFNMVDSLCSFHASHGGGDMEEGYKIIGWRLKMERVIEIHPQKWGGHKSFQFLIKAIPLEMVGGSGWSKLT